MEETLQCHAWQTLLHTFTQAAFLSQAGREGIKEKDEMWYESLILNSPGSSKDL